jgi:hypothetical protein
VLGRRINTFTWSDTGGHSSDGYIPPQEVTDAERELIYHHAGRAMQWAGYEVGG